MGTADPGRILLIDDDDDVRRDYSRLLKSLGFEVEAAADGTTALQLLSRRPFDVVVTDIHMPKMNGMEFLRAIRERDLDIPVVLMTGSPDITSAVDAVEYGATRYMVKPVDREAMAAVVRRAIHLHRLADFKRQALGIAGTPGMQMGDRASLEAHFDSAVKNLWMAYQPIVDWTGQRVYAREALVRSREESLSGALDLFDAAERLGRVPDLGRAIRDRIAQDALKAPAHELIFVNVHAHELCDDSFISNRSPLASIADRIVIEVTERVALDQVVGLASVVATLRQRGFRIALDDLGAGYAGLSSFSLLDPDFVKLDVSLIRGVDQSPIKRGLVRGIAQLCTNDLGVQVICEGVETGRERDVLIEDGMTLFQGFFFGRPQPDFTPLDWLAANASADPNVALVTTEE